MFPLPFVTLAAAALSRSSSDWSVSLPVTDVWPEYVPPKSRPRWRLRGGLGLRGDFRLRSLSSAETDDGVVRDGDDMGSARARAISMCGFDTARSSWFSS